MTRGQYIDPRAARITFQQYAENWVTHAPDPNTQASMESQLRLHAFPYLGSRPLGSPTTKRLIFTGPRGGHVWRTSLNEEVWKRALASAGVIPERKRGESYAESRENGMHALRHFYAWVLLDAGENIKALAEYLGHSDPGLTLRVYAHPMPSSQERTRKALAAVFETAQSGRPST